MSNCTAKNSECVRVAVRCRPRNAREVNDNSRNVIKCNCDEGTIEVAKSNDPSHHNIAKIFTFDAVYAPDSTQAQLYESTVFPVVDSVMSGYNGTVFAYGQTGTGKTYTMMGSNKDAKLYGIIPRALEQIFKQIQCTTDRKYLVRASFLEIYNEHIRDLLVKNNKRKLELRDASDKSAYVKDLSTHVVSNKEEIQSLLDIGNRNKKVASTLMNDESSRSHSVFTIIVESCESDSSSEGHIRMGKLNLVDLAGSERQFKTKAEGDTLKEGAKINLSLSALGNVISALVDSKTNFIPYRDSKLTRLLQDSLGGNTKTIMIANVGPAEENYDETVTTLRYANRAKRIQNKPIVNEDPRDTMLKQYQDEIMRLKEQLAKYGLEGDEISTSADPHCETNTVSNTAATPGVTGHTGAITNAEYKKMQEELSLETEKLHSKYQQEIATLEHEKSIDAGKKMQMILDLKTEIEDNENAIRDRENAMIKIKDMEEKIVQGDLALQQAFMQEQELKRAEVTLEQKRLQEIQLKRELDKHDRERKLLIEKYESSADHISNLEIRLKNAWNELEAAEEEILDIRKESQTEKEDMLDAIRQLTKELKLKSLTVENFIHPADYKLIQDASEWDEENGTWNILNIGNSGRFTYRPPPICATDGVPRPMTINSKLLALVVPNTRYRFGSVVEATLSGTSGLHSLADIPKNPQIMQQLEDSLNFSMSNLGDLDSLNFLADNVAKHVHANNDVKLNPDCTVAEKSTVFKPVESFNDNELFPQARKLVNL